MWLDCIDVASSLKDLIGPAELTREARSLYEQWYINREISKDPIVAAFERASHVHVLKTAMLLAIAKEQKLTIDTEHLELAMALVDEVAASLPVVYNAIGRNVLAQVGQKIERLLNQGPMTTKEVLGLLWRDCTREEFVQTVLFLEQQGRLVRLQKDGIEWLALPGNGGSPQQHVQ